MVSPISSATPTQLAALPTASRPQSTSARVPQPAIDDTFQPSNAIVNIATQALQETTETNSQTVKEANVGDIQAKNLLAREAAAKNL